MRPYIICHMMMSVGGRNGETAVFDGCTWDGDSPYRLKLNSVEQVSGTEVIWHRGDLGKVSVYVTSHINSDIAI